LEYGSRNLRVLGSSLCKTFAARNLFHLGRVGAHKLPFPVPKQGKGESNRRRQALTMDAVAASLLTFRRLGTPQG
jgi:hypothetical protein